MFLNIEVVLDAGWIEDVMESHSDELMLEVAGLVCGFEDEGLEVRRFVAATWWLDCTSKKRGSVCSVAKSFFTMFPHLIELLLLAVPPSLPSSSPACVH